MQIYLKKITKPLTFQVLTIFSMTGDGVMQLRKTERRIVIFPFPLQGHVIPMLHLANILHSKGFSITIIHTQYNSPNPTHFPNFTFHFLIDGVTSNNVVTLRDLAADLSALQANCHIPFQDCLSQILSESVKDQEKAPCLISDPMWAFAGSVAQSFNLPWIVFRPSGMTSFVVFDSLPFLREKGYYPLQESKLDEPIMELLPLKVRDLPAERQHGVLVAAIEQTKISQGVICNTFEELEGSSIAKVRLNLAYPIFPIGPIHKYSQASTANILTPDQTSLSWLNTQAPKSVLYVSFGSVAEISKTDFLEMAWGLANSKQPFLWVVRPGLSQGVEFEKILPAGYSKMVGERGRIVKWAPQLEVLSHPAIGGFWTHCGWNSTIESICEGVPMLCLPFFSDQTINARHVCDDWKIGLLLEKNATREDIENAIRKLMVAEEGAKMRSNIATLKEKSKHCIRLDGSSYESLEQLTSYLLSL